MLKLIRNQLNKMQVPYEYMDGSTKNRQERIDHFNDNHNIRIFLISLKTGGFGINLTSADTVIIVDPWWNPMVENQAIDRTHRIGQTKKVLVYKLITKGTVEEKILSLQQNKKELFDYIIEQGESVFQALTLDDLQKLFTY
jgi:SNF2 family DNA or RNA helicase